MTMRIALLHEHPTWSVDLMQRASERAIDLTPIDIGDIGAVSTALGEHFDLWVNRINAMPSAGRPPSIVAAASHLLTTLELQQQRVVNGSTTHRIGGSKAAQAALFAHLAMNTPATVAIYQASDAITAAEAVGFPLLTKPNVGGSGNGIVRHDTAADLQRALQAGSIDLGIDGTGVVQCVIDSIDGQIYRVEMLADSFFYGTTQPLQADAFNYCAADGCALEPGGNAISLFTPPPEIVQAAARLMAAADTLVGGVEYILDAETGEPSFYDFNPYSNFVTGLDNQLGFNPIDRYLDFILALGSADGDGYFPQ